MQNQEVARTKCTYVESIIYVWILSLYLDSSSNVEIGIAIWLFIWIAVEFLY
jgi:hypothetical protein